MRVLLSFLLLTSNALAALPTLYESDFKNARYGCTPAGWRDEVALRPSRGWVVDGNGMVRHVLKLRTGLLTYDGYTSNVKPAKALADARLVAEFQKTEDAAVSFGIVGRVVDARNYYLARFSGTDRLELVKVKAGVESALDFRKPVTEVEARTTGIATLRRYREGDRWTLSFTLDGDHLLAAVHDAEGREMARIAAVDGDFQQGRPGLRATTFAAAASFRIESLTPFEAKADVARLAKRNAVLSSEQPDYPVVRPLRQPIDTPREKIGADYDVVIAGAGTGGWAAAVQAARMGARVLLIEETDWIGGQMSCAAVTTMDEDGVWMKFPVRERGIYREFHESMVTHYHTLNKDPLVAYYGYPEQHEGGYEPKVARAVLQGFIQEARERKAVLDLSLRTRVAAVKKSRDAVTGATLSFADASQQEVACKVLIDATE